MHEQSTRNRPGPKPQAIPERFWKKVNKDGPTPPHRSELGQCWVWTGLLFHDGYGLLPVRHPKQTTLRTHRLSWELHNGPIPNGLQVLHECDNPACCNPSHLFLGTHADNQRDKVNKGRQAHGDMHYMTQETPHEFVHERRTNAATLTGDQVREIRRRYAAGNVLYAELGKEYGVTHRTIGLIVRCERWIHIE